MTSENWLRFTTIFGLLPVLLVATTALTPAKETTPVLPRTKPNQSLNLERQQGSCPKTVRLWTLARQYEGGAANTVIADTMAIAGAAQLISSGDKFVQYKAPLKKAYSSCVGKAAHEEHYRFRFEKGVVYFRVDLSAIAANPATPAKITYKNVIASRPYVRWAVAD